MPQILKEPKLLKLRKLCEAAPNYECVMCGAWKAYTVAAHCNDVTAKGIGRKAPDFMVAYLCGVPGGCHDKADGRAGGWTLEEKRAFWNEAYRRTVAIWFREMWVFVK
jgi:hypothetical protein